MVKMNTQQRNYMAAKALVDTLEAEAVRIEQNYISLAKIVNPDGSVPEKVWMIEDNDLFDIANEVTAPDVDALGLCEAQETLRDAESDLIKYGLSIAPAHERQVLSDLCFGQNGHYVHVDIRQKVIDLVLKLDVSTVPAAAV